MNRTPPTNKFQFWAIWAALLIGVIVLIAVLRGGWPQGADEVKPSTFWVILSASGVIIGSLIRWVVIPRIKKVETLMTVSVIGMAMCELSVLFGLLIISNDSPATQRALLLLGIAGIAQFAPIYANRFFESED